VLELRFVAGFQFADFADEAIKDLLAEEFTVTAKANRMGVTLNGERLHSGISELHSEATCYGAIQVPPDGKPIILLNDRQTVGGYPKPGAVISSDCLRLAQSRPGQRVRFAECSPEEADRIGWLEQHYLETRLRDRH
jgi:allophanate hydrolase subunit 2